jgi:hypothetical protein
MLTENHEIENKEIRILIRESSKTRRKGTCD